MFWPHFVVKQLTLLVVSRAQIYDIVKQLTACSKPARIATKCGLGIAVLLRLFLVCLVDHIDVFKHRKDLIVNGALNVKFVVAIVNTCRQIL